MRFLVTVGLVIGLAGSASALTLEECLQSTGGLFVASCQQRVLESQHVEIARVQAQAQVEAARQQAMGLALFGSGNALVNGMNQGLARMQVQPYYQPPPPHFGR